VGGGGGGGAEIYCGPYSALQESFTLFLTRFRTYKIASPPLTKMTSKEDNKGLVSLKFLRPWYVASADYGKQRRLSKQASLGHLENAAGGENKR
jgi:hypothetical protein